MHVEMAGLYYADCNEKATSCLHKHFCNCPIRKCPSCDGQMHEADFPKREEEGEEEGEGEGEVEEEGEEEEE